jgi:hypothetical protein
VRIRLAPLGANDGDAENLRHGLKVLAPRSTQAEWMVSAVKPSDMSGELFEATGEGGEALELLAETNERISGRELEDLAGKTRQVIWGEFVGSLPTAPQQKWVTIGAVDSTFYEVVTADEQVLKAVRSVFKDLR